MDSERNITAVWLIDASNGAILEVPDAYASLFGFDPAELRDDPLAWLRALRLEDRAGVRTRFLNGLLGGDYDEELRLTNGERFRDRLFPIPGSSSNQVMRLTERVLEPMEDPGPGAISFDVLFSANPNPCWIFDHETLRFVAVNNAALTHYGYTRAEFLSMRAIDIRPPDEVIRFTNSRTSVQPGYTPFGVWRHIRKDGSEIHAQILSHGLVYNGRPARLVTAIDVTERIRTEHALRSSEQRYRTIVETAQEGIWTCDADLNTLFINGPGAAILGTKPENILGKSALRVFQSTPALEAALDRLRSTPNATERFDIPWRRPDGVEILMRASCASLRGEDGSFQGIVSMFVDISDRRRLEQELQAKAVELMRSNLDLEQFAYVISHDLQEPLRTIASYLQLIEHRYSESIDNDGREFIEFAVGGSRRMNRMIKDLLDYSRIGRKGFEPAARCSLNLVAQRAMHNLDFAIDESRATVVADPLPEVKASPALMLQLFQNLIGNAIKYRRDESPIVKITSEKKGQEWIITVADNGIGIDPAHLDRIFGVFKRLHGPEVPGTGIGLAVCRRIVQVHGGRIWAESTPGVGSRFCFSLPEA